MYLHKTTHLETIPHKLRANINTHACRRTHTHACTHTHTNTQLLQIAITNLGSVLKHGTDTDVEQGAEVLIQHYSAALSTQLHDCVVVHFLQWNNHRTTAQPCNRSDRYNIAPFINTKRHQFQSVATKLDKLFIIRPLIFNAQAIMEVLSGRPWYKLCTHRYAM